MLYVEHRVSSCPFTTLGCCGRHKIRSAVSFEYRSPVFGFNFSSKTVARYQNTVIYCVLIEISERLSGYQSAVVGYVYLDVLFQVMQIIITWKSPPKDKKTAEPFLVNS